MDKVNDSPQKKSFKFQSYKKDLLLILLLGVLVVFWFGPLIFSNNIFVHRDLARYFYPLRKFSAESIKGFHAPLWNPYISCGKPFLATLQTCVFYPLSLIYYIFPSFDVAFNFYIISHFFLAGLFMYCLMKHWNLSRPACFASSIVFVCSGYLSSVISMNTTLGSVIWVPVIFLFYDKALKTRNVKFVFLTAVLLGCQFLGGIPTPIYCTFWLLFFYTLVGTSRPIRTGLLRRTFGALRNDRNSRHPERSEGSRTIRNGLVIFIVIFVIFILLFMFQILPFKELLDNSNLAAGRSYKAASKWSVTPIELLAFVIPYIRGDINVPSGHLGPQEWLISFYLGIPTLIFTVLLFFLKPTRKAYFLGAALIGSLVLALGKYTPVYPFLYKYLPGINNVRYPAKFIFVTTFSLSILAGMGVEALLNEDRISKKRTITKWILSINVCLAILVALFFYFWQEIGNFLMGHFFRDKVVTGDMFNKHVFVFLNDSKYLCQFFIVFTAAAFLLVAYLSRKMARQMFICLAMALLIGDLASVNMGITKVMDRRYFSLVPESIKEIKKDNSMFRIFQTEDMWEINRSIYGLSYAEGMHERKKTFASNTTMQYGIYSTRGYGSIETGDYYNFMLFLKEQPLKARIKLLSLLNVKYIVSAKPVEGEGIGIFYKDKMYKSTLMDGTKVYQYFYVNKNSNCMERAFLADEAVFVPDGAVALGIMQTEEFDPRKVVVIEEDVRHQISDIRYETDESVEIVSYKPEEVIIQAIVAEQKWLVLSDIYYPGWKVFVDGKRDKIYKADYFLRAVYLQPGEHVVRFIYDPASFKIGLGLSLLMLIGIVIFMIRHNPSSRL